MLDEGTPLFVQISEQLADDIADGTLPEGERVPSSNEFAVYHRINPATAAKGINMLVDQGLLEKRRGVGMFVVAGARKRLLARRRDEFAVRYLAPLLSEARRIGVDDVTLIEMIRSGASSEPIGGPAVTSGAAGSRTSTASEGSR
jgi:DNA-binding transcriptional regulator YhcF (GntR family)